MQKILFFIIEMKGQNFFKKNKTSDKPPIHLFNKHN